MSKSNWSSPKSGKVTSSSSFSIGSSGLGGSVVVAGLGSS